MIESSQIWYVDEQTMAIPSIFDANQVLNNGVWEGSSLYPHTPQDLHYFAFFMDQTEPSIKLSHFHLID
jgi:hypothetical protein